MKKKIAFVLTSFVVGGVEKSFLDLLDCIDFSRYDITIYLPDRTGEWTALLEDKYKVKILPIFNYRTIVLDYFKKLQLLEIIKCSVYRVLARIYRKRDYAKRTVYFIKSMPREKEIYDFVGAYQIINDDCAFGSLYRINAAKKAVWSHLDMNRSSKTYRKLYGQFDRIFCVSEYSKNAILKAFPMLSSKIEILHNIVNTSDIISKSLETIELETRESEIVLVTVARLAAIKGQTMIPATARILIERGYSIRWYLVGEGEYRNAIETAIATEKIKNHVHLIGRKDNPYPYIKACDIYVQTSLVEGWGLTVSEAKVLNKPVVTTDAGVMSEQITSGVNGIITSEATPEALANAIENLIIHPELREKFVENLKKENFEHKKELEKLFAFIDS